MNLRKPLVLAAVAGALVAGTALPASAATTGDTTTTFELTAGSLALTVAGTANLGPDTSGTTAISGSLGAVSVTDNRGGTANWNVSGASTAFTGPLGSSSDAVSYTGGGVTTTGTIVVAPGTATTMSTAPASVVAPTSLSGNNTASWTPQLAVTMPAGALADNYSGTVTTSIL